MLQSSENVHALIAPPREWDVAPCSAVPTEPAPSPRLEAFLAANSLPTPYLVVDLDVIEARHRAFRTTLPDVEIYYAIKANPHPQVLDRLVRSGSSFETASLAEVERCLAAGASSDRLCFSNPIKKEADIARAYRLGVRLFAFDSAAELGKLVRAAPGAAVFCRLLIECAGAEWPLSRKFGCDPAMAVDLLRQAAQLGLRPRGVSFHVGSQQLVPDQWDVGIAAAAEVFFALLPAGIELDLVNLGGGFPGRYREPVPPLAAYGAAIRTAMTRHFGPYAKRLRLIAEVGRGLVAEAGVIDSEVVLVSRKRASDRHRWVYLDCGVFNGLIETIGESIRFPIRSSAGGEAAPVILAGSTCDSMDILYEKAGYHLPAQLAIGDRIQILTTGAYTYTYSSVEFNGMPPLPVVCI
jgi:ornithine decarboxylase